MRLQNKQKRHRGTDLFSAVTIAVALLVILFIGSAICAIAAGGISSFAGTIRQKEVLSALRLSAVTASLSTLIVMALALPTAYALTRTSMPFKELSGIIIELTLSLPYLLLGLSLLIMFSSPAGKWLKEQGFKVVFAPAGIVMAHILVNLPYAIRLIRTAFEASDQRMEFIARTLGASPWKCFLTILLPLCRRSLVSTFILTTRFKTETLPGSIYLSISTGDNQAAMATAMLMLMISGLTLFLSRLLNSPADRSKRQVYIR